MGKVGDGGHILKSLRKISNFRGHLKQKRAKSHFFEGQGEPW